MAASIFDLLARLVDCLLQDIMRAQLVAAAKESWRRGHADGESVTLR
jgi:hypothetical protein